MGHKTDPRRGKPKRTRKLSPDARGRKSRHTCRLCGREFIGVREDLPLDVVPARVFGKRDGVACVVGYLLTRGVECFECAENEDAPLSPMGATVSKDEKVAMGASAYASFNRPRQDEPAPAEVKWAPKRDQGGGKTFSVFLDKFRREVFERRVAERGSTPGAYIKGLIDQDLRPKDNLPPMRYQADYPSHDIDGGYGGTSG